MCYTVPIASAIMTSAVWRKTKSAKVWWLNLMLYGGALFGFVDHLWNGELFLISDNIVKDLSLGVVITLSIFAAWGLMLALSRVNPVLAYYLKVDSISS